MIKRDELRIRDPFILADKEKDIYYVYGTTDLVEEALFANKTFSVYTSKDLENFEGPFVVFDGEKNNFWADRDYWAAEVHKYKGKYYLIGSFKSNDKHRASCILSSDSPLGEFSLVSNKARTPENWDCLDGTLYIENGEPYLVFSHEWLQCTVGEMWAQKMKDDLSEPVGEPFMLFKATDSPYVTSFADGFNSDCRVTDGPFLFKENGKLKMIWSSFSNNRYVVLEAESDSINGKWSHLPPRFDFDGGHAMIFEKNDGEKNIVLHSPNTPPYERIKLIKYEE